VKQPDPRDCLRQPRGPERTQKGATGTDEATGGRGAVERREVGACEQLKREKKGGAEAAFRWKGSPREFCQSTKERIWCKGRESAVGAGKGRTIRSQGMVSKGRKGTPSVFVFLPIAQFLREERKESQRCHLNAEGTKREECAEKGRKQGHDGPYLSGKWGALQEGSWKEMREGFTIITGGRTGQKTTGK